MYQANLLQSEEDLLKEAVAGLNVCQKKAFEALIGPHNVFLTGGAGTGKTFVIHKFIEYMKARGIKVPVVASTGAAAILAGGQTFHRFFTLNVATDVDALIEFALSKPFVKQRLARAKVLIFDEISMLPGYVFEAAYRIAQIVRQSELPWGGIKIIVVGDFRQLPPVAKRGESTPWSFLTDSWTESDFTPVMLQTPVRSVDPHFVSILNDARLGKCTDRIAAFLDSKVVGPSAHADFPRLFGRKVDVDRYNLERLGELPGKEVLFETRYLGVERYVEDLKKDAPIPPTLRLKVGALIMMRQNDKHDRYVNGSLGHVTYVDQSMLIVKLLSGEELVVDDGVFMYNNNLGDVYATATNYPMTLAWATTIHKSQGATMDKVLIDLTELWEPGQMYVALSRVRTPEGVAIVKWDKRAFKCDKKVSQFHKELLELIGSLQ
jgi:ATP-dependent DNA helicase PIF1